MSVLAVSCKCCYPCRLNCVLWARIAQHSNLRSQVGDEWCGWGDAFSFESQNSIMKSANMRIPSLISRPVQYLPSIGSIGSISTIFLVLREVLVMTRIGLRYLIPPGLITAFFRLGPGIVCAGRWSYQRKPWSGSKISAYGRPSTR
jgi:hypothetical protein